MTLAPLSGSTVRSRFSSLLACGLMLTSTIGIAQSQTTWFGEVADGEWLAGIKLGAVAPDIPGFDTAPIASLVIGYQFARPIGDRGTASIELEIGTSQDADINESGIYGPGNYDVHTAGLFMNYRTAGTVYFKGKVGVLDSNIDARYDSGQNIKFNDAAFALGLGLGVRLGGEDARTVLEGEWVTASGDNDINYFHLGANIEF
jgi:hypothetical protein